MAYPDNPEVASSYSFQIYGLSQILTFLNSHLDIMTQGDQKIGQKIAQTWENVAQTLAKSRNAKIS
jgi:hypothetical protein